jgi:hypothetical protein
VPAVPRGDLRSQLRREPHRDEQDSARFAGLVDRDDVRVVDRGRGLRLAHEPQPERLVARQRRGHDLQGHEPAEADVAGLVDHGHATRADLPFEQVSRNLRTRSKDGLRAAPARKRVLIHRYLHHWLSPVSMVPSAGCHRGQNADIQLIKDV